MSRLVSELKLLAEAFEGRNVSLNRVTIYAEDLEDLPEDQVIDAILRLRRTSRFFPTISEIREATVAGQPTEGLAEMAWSEVLREAGRVGYGGGPIFRNGEFHEREKPRFSSPITEATVASVGWKAICHTEDARDQVFLRNQFLKTWDALASRTLKQAQTGQTLDILTALNPPKESGMHSIGAVMSGLKGDRER
jgi:hypothetical protein